MTEPIDRGQGGLDLSSLAPVWRADPPLTHWLNGWQSGVVAVGLAALAAILLVPLPATPHVVPAPTVDRREELDVAMRDRALAATGQDQPLPFAVRLVGERWRRLGAATAQGQRERAGRELTELRLALQEARARHGEPPLLTLRAIQTELFLAALIRWEATGHVEPDLTELGGDFLTVAARNCWTRQGRLRLSEAERRTLFRLRWGELTGAGERPPFAPSLNEWRAYFRFLLAHPERPASLSPTPVGRAVAQRRLLYVEALARRDPTYPASFARGVLWAQLGNSTAAMGAFQTHLDDPSQRLLRPWARNHVAALLATAPAPD